MVANYIKADSYCLPPLSKASAADRCTLYCAVILPWKPVGVWSGRLTLMSAICRSDCCGHRQPVRHNLTQAWLCDLSHVFILTCWWCQACAKELGKGARVSIRHALLCHATHSPCVSDVAGTLDDCHQFWQKQPAHLGHWPARLAMQLDMVKHPVAVIQSSIHICMAPNHVWQMSLLIAFLLQICPYAW